MTDFSTNGFMAAIRDIINQTASANLQVEETPAEDRCPCRGDKCQCDWCAPERHEECSAACCNDACECS